jgi:hypothetical protein
MEVLDMTFGKTLLVAGVTAAAFPAAASAAAAPIGGGAVIIKPVRGFEARLAHAHTQLAALRPAGYHAGYFTLAVAGGQFAFTSGAGTLADRGALRLRHGGRIVMIKSLSFTLGSPSKVTALVGDRRMSLFSVSLRQAHGLGSSTACAITGLRLTFTPAAAARVDALLGSNAVGVRGVAAVATVLVEAQPGSAGASPTSGASSPPTGTAPTAGAPTAGAPNPSGVGGQALPGVTGVLGQLGIPGVSIPGLPTIPGLPPVPGVSGSPGLPLPGLPSLPVPSLPVPSLPIAPAL